MKFSSTGPSSTLPSFFFMAGDEEGGSLYSGYNYTGGYGRGEQHPFNVKTSCPDDVFDNTMKDIRVPQLPWRLQEDWGCELESRDDIEMIVLENDFLRATIAPQWGGKIWSLYDKIHQREMFFKNPSHQPANIGYRKAWVSGGAEWNWSPGYIGHSVFTEEPVWTAIFETKMGPLVRVYEYDRINSTVWQVDMILKDDLLIVHPKITNPNPSADLQGYWWTCVAMPISGPKARVLSPASVAVDGDGQCSPWPWGQIALPNVTFRGPDLDQCASTDTCAYQSDQSFLGNIPFHNDYFFHIEPDQTPWISIVQEDGYSVVHSHPNWLNGTKFFTWGWNEFGYYNQDFLAGTDTRCAHSNNDMTTDQHDTDEQVAYDPYCMDGHPGMYTELQIGPARTQLHTFDLPAQSSLEWTEWFKSFSGDPKKLQHQNYRYAVQQIDDWIVSPDGVSSQDVDELDALMRSMADIPPTQEQIVFKGMPWGGMKLAIDEHMKKKSTPLAPGCPFEYPERTVETKPWLELLEGGTFSEETLTAIPVNFEVSDDWISLLDLSVKNGNHNATWLHWLYLGTHALEVGNAELATIHFHQSINQNPSVHAYRNLAIIAPTQDLAIDLYQKAWSLWKKTYYESKNEHTSNNNVNHDELLIQLGTDLSGEIAGWMIGNERWIDLGSYMESVEEICEIHSVFCTKDRILHAKVSLAVQSYDYETALRTLKGHCFATYGSVRQDLLALWWTANKQKATAEKKSKSEGGDTVSPSLTTREMLELRRKIRCDGDQSHQGIDDPCVCGPPNLGYAY